jgi:hypothetical protein
VPDLELLRKLAPPVEPPPPPARFEPRTRRRPLLLLTPIAVGAAVLALLATQLGGQRFAEAAIRAAESSPRLLVEGWEVTRVDEWSAGRGEMTFARDGRTLDLSWGDEGPLKDGIERLRGTRVAGAPATVGRFEGTNDFVARWDDVLARGVAPSAEAFVETLEDIHRVGAEEWLEALPDSAVAPRAQAATVQEMLRGIPVPPGFVAPEATGETRDRYQLGARVAGAVACAWIERGGDEARGALATARRWPILNEMNAAGDYPEVLWQYADAFASGGDVAAGKPGVTVQDSYRDALGC